MMKQVSREEYLTFVKNYPNKLDFNCVTICEPPMGRYHDFSISKDLRESVVAREVRNWLTPSGKVVHESPNPYWEYYIKEN